MALSDIIGHAEPVRMLRGAIARDRVPSAYIFTGQEGVGKRFTAVSLAMALNCTGGSRLLSGGAGERDACGQCPSCMKIRAGNHPDVRIVEPDGAQIKVEQVREAMEALSLMAHEGAYKVLILDNADRLNPAAANALLKTLEEPGPRTLIVLVSAAPDTMPPTILSRCSRIRFRPLGLEEAERVLSGLLKGKRAQQAGELARLSMGRPGLALNMDLLKVRKKVLDAIGDMLGGETNPSWTDRQEIERWFDMTLIMLRDAALLEGMPPGAVINHDVSAELGSYFPGVGINAILGCYERLLRMRADLLYNPNKRIMWNRSAYILREASGGA